MLTVKDLNITFSRYYNSFSQTTLNPLHNIDLNLSAGEIVAIVGESGGGKSLLAHAILDILPTNAELKGTIQFREKLIDSNTIRQLRGREISLIPQSVSYLNPLIRVGKQVCRAARIGGLTKEEARMATDAAFTRFNLAPEVQSLFPFQLSGGMAQRILVAIATVAGASLIVADEPTTGLDPDRVTVFLDLLRMLADEGKAALLITHDLGAAQRVADRIAVFHGGTLVEVVKIADGSEVDNLVHPYSRALWEALPDNGFSTNGSSFSSHRHGNDEPLGCLFVKNCDRAEHRCRITYPDLVPAGNNMVRCLNA